MNHYPIEQITVPTLVVHALDDPLCSYQAAERAASRIPRGRLVTVAAGCHLMLDQAAVVAPAIAAFLAEAITPSDSQPEGTASVASLPTSYR